LAAGAPVMVSVDDVSMLTLLRRLWGHLSRRRRIQFVLLMFLVLASACAEVMSIGAVVPFVAVLAQPERVLRQPVVAHFAQAWHITSASQIVLPLTVTFASVAVIAAGIRMLLLWSSTRFTFVAGADLSNEVYRRTLYQPYRVHIARGTSEIISAITTKVGGTVLGVILPLLTLMSATTSLLAILVALLVIDPAVATAAAGGFGVTYGATTLISRRRLRRNSEGIATAQTDVVKALQEGLGGIRDVLLDGTQGTYCEIYRRADRELRRAQGSNIFIAQNPRYVVEAVGMVLIAALAYALTREPGGIGAAIPILATLAIAAQRLLPTLQQSYNSWATMAGSHALLADTLRLLDQPLPVEAAGEVSALEFERAIRFADVRFRYANDGPWVLSDVNLTIVKGTRIGIVGATGSGKSTLLDLLMGLLAPTEGDILVDDQSIRGERLRAWQRTIAHVPQAIYLADASVAENIAFGVPASSIDMERVRDAAARAQIAEFVGRQPGGYAARVGERGVRLSGGERQRIGIARALYKNAGVLILDEATSSLDNITERSVMDSIESLDRHLTILIIAHRLSTVRSCDIILHLERGRLVGRGSYEQLLEQSDGFREMVGATNS
jgi:ATP-binding cassette, subfamily B, bacterial PglK